MNEEIIKELKEIKQLLSAQKKVLSFEEFCNYAGISKSYAYHLTSKNKIKFYRPFGKMIYFDMDEVVDFLKCNPINGEAENNKIVNKYFLNK